MFKKFYNKQCFALSVLLSACAVSITGCGSKASSTASTVETEVSYATEISDLSKASDPTETTDLTEESDPAETTDLTEASDSASSAVPGAVRPRRHAACGKAPRRTVR